MVLTKKAGGGSRQIAKPPALRLPQTLELSRNSAPNGADFKVRVRREAGHKLRNVALLVRTDPARHLHEAGFAHTLLICPLPLGVRKLLS